MTYKNNLHSFGKLLINIKASKIGHIDNQVLFYALVLLFFCGLKKNEITSLKIKNLEYQGYKIIKINITPSGNSPMSESEEIVLTQKAEKTLKNYLGYLKKNYSIGAESPLFPKYFGKKGEKKLGRDLGRFSKFDGIGIRKIRKIAVTHYYRKVKKAGLNEQNSLTETAEQFRITEKSVNNILKDTITPAGRKRPTDQEQSINRILEIFDEIPIWEVSKSSFMKDLSEYIIEFNDTVDKLNNFAPNEIVKIKETFLNSLAVREIYLNPRSKAIYINIKGERRNQKPVNLQEAIESFVTKSENYDTEDLEKYFFGNRN
jgi:hypothetical protein